MQAVTTANAGIFSKNVTEDVKNFITRDMIRILFFARMTQTQLSEMGKQEFMSEDIRKTLHSAAEVLRQLDMKTRSKLDPKQALWLTNELKKDKVADIYNLVDIAAHVSNDGTATDYEGIMGLATDFLDKTVHLQIRKKKLNFPKLRAIFRFITEEMKAEAENGLTAVEFNESTDCLSFLLVQPDAQIPAKPAQSK